MSFAISGRRGRRTLTAKEAKMSNEGNEKKRWGRRATTAAATIVLSTVAYYICLFKGIDLNWFVEYSKVLLYILGFVAGSLTITDSILAYKK